MDDANESFAQDELDFDEMDDDIFSEEDLVDIGIEIEALLDGARYLGDDIGRQRVWDDQVSEDDIFGSEVPENELAGEEPMVDLEDLDLSVVDVEDFDPEGAELDDMDEVESQPSSHEEDQYFADPRTHDRFELLSIPSEEHWKLSLEHRNLSLGELEPGRKPGARRITWLVEYAREEGDP